MEHWTASFTTLDRIFLLTALIGAIAVVYRLCALFLGGDLDGHDFGVDGDAGGDGFQVLSIHGLASFFMMFGLVGLALSRQSRAGAGLSLLGGILAGLGAIWVISQVFRSALKLQSNGTLQPASAAGCLGTVYLTIPAGGTGRVSVRIGQRLREMDAIHDQGAEVPTGTPVRVVRVERSLAVVQTFSSTEL
jgi:hypothetical protein